MSPVGSGASSSSGAQTGEGPVGQGDHVVRRGEDMASIAARYGFFWKTLWNHADNAELKRVRKDPNVLLEGDRVTIPDLRASEYGRSTEARHRFRRKGVPSKLKMQLLRDDEPRSGVSWEFEVVGQTHSGSTDAEGYLELPVPPGADRGTLTIREGERVDTRVIRIGSLDPVTTVRGVQQRLRNLQFACPTDGKMGDETKGALAEFQRRNGLDADGELDDDTRDTLKKIHGS